MEIQALFYSNLTSDVIKHIYTKLYKLKSISTELKQDIETYKLFNNLKLLYKKQWANSEYALYIDICEIFDILINITPPDIKLVKLWNSLPYDQKNSLYDILVRILEYNISNYLKE